MDKYKLTKLEDFKIHYSAKRDITDWFSKTTKTQPFPTNSLIVVSGPPGIGKSTLVELVCLKFEYSPYVFDLCLFENREQLITRLNALSARTKDVEGFNFAIILESIDSVASELVSAVSSLLPKMHVPVIAVCNNAYSPFPRSLCQKHRHVKMYPVSTDDMFQIALRMNEIFRREMGRSAHGGDLVRTDVRHIAVSSMGDIRRCFYLTILTLSTHTTNIKKMVNAGCADRHLLNPFDVAKALFDPYGSLTSRRNAADAAEDTNNLQMWFIYHNHPSVEPEPSLDTLAATADRLSVCDTLAIYASEHSSLYLLSGEHTGKVELEFPKQPHTDAKFDMILDTMKESAVGMRYTRRSGLLLDVHQHLTGKAYTSAMGRDPVHALTYQNTIGEFGLDSFRDKSTAELVLRKVQQEQGIRRSAASTFKPADGEQHEALTMANLISSGARITGTKRPVADAAKAASAAKAPAAKAAGLVKNDIVQGKPVLPSGLAPAAPKKKVDKSRLPPVEFVSNFPGPLPEGMRAPKVQKQIGNYFQKKKD